jgi:sigma-E factor negative regulatory protein RseA
MPNKPVDTEIAHALMSALVDGELDSGEADQACALWRASGEARVKWNDYHLIGDVLRSEELARKSSHDSAFLARVQAELARQPVVFAPDPGRTEALDTSSSPATIPASPHRVRPRAVRWAWLAPSAVAAGVVMVAGAWTLTRAPLDEPGGTLTASRVQAPPQIIATSASSPAAAVELADSAAGNGAVVRDAQLDRYLAAHKQFSSAAVLGGAPPGSLRQVAAEASGR